MVELVRIKSRFTRMLPEKEDFDYGSDCIDWVCVPRAIEADGQTGRGI